MKDKEQASLKANLQELQEDFNWTVNRRNQSIFRRQQVNYRARYNIWDGQSEDGRKWKPLQDDEEVFPWPGAADTRIHLIDGYINEDVALLMTVWRRNRIVVSSTEINDAQLASRLTQVLRWMKYTQMREAINEVKLLAQWRLERGLAVCGVFWDRQTQLGYQDLDLEDLAILSMDAQAQLSRTTDPEEQRGLERVADLPRIVADPARQEEARDIFLSYYPDVDPGRVNAILNELRKTGHVRFPRPYILRDRPTIVALAPNEDVFIPQDAADIQTARSVYRRELLTETNLRDRINTHNWDGAWVEEMIATQRGQVSGLPTVSPRQLSGGLAYSGGRYGTGTPDPQNLFEVIHAYRRQHDEQGVPGLYYTCYNPGLVAPSSARKSPYTYAYHGLLNYDHGKQPFVLMRREMRSRLIDDSRGYGEIGGTWQDGIKAEVDSRRDRASIATCPPMFHPHGRPPSRWGPGVKVATSESARYGFFKGPQEDRGSQESEQTLRTLADRYFARVGDENAREAQLMRQAMADDWMDDHTDIDTQILQLMQQFMPEQFYYRVVGSSRAKPIRADRQDIQGQFDVSISYNVANLDPERVDRHFTFIERALAWDTGGRIDRDELVSIGFELIDPNLGERVLKPAQEAAAEEIDDERNVLAQMAVGIPVDVQAGQAWALRLDYLERTITQSDQLRQRYEQDEQFRKRVDDRLQQLRHQVEQHTVNAQAGRLGGRPEYARTPPAR